jgi:hypothetical protein
MKRLITSVIRLLAVLIVPITIGLSVQVAAVNILPACDPGGTAVNTDICQNVNNSDKTQNPVIRALKVAIMFLSIIIGITAVIMIIVGGLWLMTANGDAQAISRARSSIFYALIGLVVAGLAQVLVAFVLNKI